MPVGFWVSDPRLPFRNSTMTLRETPALTTFISVTEEEVGTRRTGRT